MMRARGHPLGTTKLLTHCKTGKAVPACFRGSTPDLISQVEHMPHLMACSLVVAALNGITSKVKWRNATCVQRLNMGPS